MRLRPHDLAWKSDAACIDEDPELFFGDGRIPNRVFELCNGCQVKEECLDYALVEGYVYIGSGVWGGTTSTQRRTDRELRKRARHLQELAAERGYTYLPDDW